MCGTSFNNALTCMQTQPRALAGLSMQTQPRALAGLLDARNFCENDQSLLVPPAPMHEPVLPSSPRAAYPAFCRLQGPFTESSCEVRVAAAAALQRSPNVAAAG